MIVERYSSLNRKAWNTFVKTAKNSTFLFDRDFMEYHQDRFTDHSLLIKNENNHIIGCFPANETKNKVIHSHQGLTYGALMFKKDLKLTVVMELFETVLDYYKSQGMKTLYYKAFPRFYNEGQTDELEYSLFINNATLYRRDTAIAVDREHRINYSGNIRREAKKALQSGIFISEDNNIEDFWNTILTPNLESRFDVKPVHTAEEIKFLKNKFPDKIKLYTATDTAGEILAGTVFFLMDNVAHCQYISANDKGRREGALNLLFVTLLDEYFQEMRYFDFGIANEDNGRHINTGLLAWKERMGGRTYSHDFYEVDLTGTK